MPSPSKLADLIDARGVQPLLDDFYGLTHIPMSVLDLEGRVLAAAGEQEICARFHRVHPDTCRACAESHARLTAGVLPGEIRLYKCRNDLWEMATPVTIGDSHMGTFFSGQFLFDDDAVDVEAFRRRARRCRFEEAAYMAALDRVPRVTQESVNRALAFFVRLARTPSQPVNAGFGAERRLLNIVMQATDVMFAYLDREFRFVWVNPAYAEGANRRPEELVGRHHFALYPDAENEAIFRRVRETGEPVFYKDKPFQYPDQPERGTTYWDWSLVPVKDTSDTVTGLVFSLRDTTKAKQAELERDRLADQRQLALDAARMGWWHYDPVSRNASYDARYCEIFGVTGREQPNEEILKLLHPDDLPRVWAAVEAAMDPADPKPYSTEFRVNRPDGEPRWVEAHGIALFGGDGPGRKATSFVGTVADITERKRAEEQLRQANARLQEDDRHKNEFIAVLSHELRNPLAPIRLALPRLRHQPLDDAGHRALSVITRQTNQMTRLVDDLLDIARITNGKIELRRERVSLGAVFAAATEAASPEIIGRRHTLRTRIVDDPIWLHADPPRLAQVITNLLDNSSKYTPHGGEIVLEARRESGQAVVSVRDNGIGIPAPALGYVFDMFRQVDRDEKPQGGLGIGLALTKRLVEMHGGTIEARSAGVGQGSEFLIRLPLADETRQAPLRAPGPAPAPRRRLRVLVVDDNADLLEMLTLLVEAAGHEVRKALDGRSAVSQALSYRPHLVLLDLGLPGLSGLDVARELRQHAETKNTRLVALTGWGQEEDRRRTSAAGFDNHLTKPVEPDAVERVLAEVAAERIEGPV